MHIAHKTGNKIPIEYECEFFWMAYKDFYGCPTAFWSDGGEIDYGWEENVYLRCLKFKSLK